MMKVDTPGMEEPKRTGSRPAMGKEEILNRLKQGGYRITKQRLALLEVILESECSCCKEIYFYVHKKMPRIGIATIYRMMNTLEEIGAIERKNLYQICPRDRDKIENCIVQYSEGMQIRLSAENLHRVVEEGMKKLGLADKNMVQQIIAIHPLAE
ncbi:MAG: Fur family transcriptional regulator [Lachnospiraceae bacterium]